MRKELEDVLKESFNSLISNVHTALPGRIESYDPALKKVSVKPLIQKKFENGEVLSYPVISNVPVVFPGTTDTLISFPLNRGDGCLLLFSERSMERFLSSSLEEVEPQDPRKFSLSDAICIPGLFTFSNPGRTPSGTGSDLEVIFKDASIKISPDGAVKINGEDKSFVTYTALNTALQAFRAAVNSTFTTKSDGAGTPGATSIDITASETQTVKTGG